MADNAVGMCQEGDFKTHFSILLKIQKFSFINNLKNVLSS